jgi:hypothetical protein
MVGKGALLPRRAHRVAVFGGHAELGIGPAEAGPGGFANPTTLPYDPECALHQAFRRVRTPHYSIDPKT